MNSPFRVLAATTLVLIFAAPMAFAQRGGGGRRGGDAPAKAPEWRGNAQISGKITDEAGKGINEARVTFVFVKSNDGFFATTKKNGEFTAKDIKAGDWRMQVDAPNFITVRQPVTIADRNAPVNVQLKRDNSPELLTKAETLFKEGKNADARAEYLKVLDAHPELTGINRAIAFTYGKEGNHPEALKYLDLALSANASDSMLLQLAAASAMQVNDFPRAMGYLSRIDEAALDQPTVLEDAAVNLINKRRSADAVTILDRAIARFPTAADLFFYRGFARLQGQKTPEGRADLEQFVAMASPDSPRLAQAKDLLSSIK